MDTPHETHKSIIPMDIEKQMKSAFIDYSMSVIVSRALPDVRDGMKPVHRRILYSMFNSGITPDKGYSKSAATAGDVIKYFHPHGEASVYDALVRLAQDFSMRYPLVDGQGNFGSVDGDPAAAMRYTEARLAKISMDMMTDIEKDTVDFAPNYDGRYKEPTVLPSRFPNILVNGSVGIAVGMATNIPPHNLSEVIDATCYQIDHPDCTLDDLMQFIKGPDFPTGGTIIGRAGIRAAYATGRGTIRLRSKCDIIEENGRARIEVTEIPYMVNKVRLVKGIADLVKEKRIDGIADLADHSDRLGLKIVIDLKREANPQVVLNQLCMYSQLQENVSVIMLALSGGQPKIMTLKQMLGDYIAYQKEVVTRRIRFDLKRALKRDHILRGLRIAIDNIDEVINIIRSSKTEAAAKIGLQERFELDEEQSQAIVDMRMGRLTGLERDKLDAEIADIEAKIAEYQSILASEEKLFSVIKKDLMDIRKKYGDERRTQLELVDDEIDVEDLIENVDNVFTLTQAGYVKRLPTDAYRAQKRGGRGVSGHSLREEDAVRFMMVTKTHNPILFFTDRGRVFRLKGYQIPQGSRTAKGTNIINILQIEQDERITAVMPVPPLEGEESRNLMLCTRQGIVKRMSLSALSNIRKVGLKALNLREDDALVSVALTNGRQDVVVASHEGQAIRFAEDEAREMGRTATGVIGLRLAEGDYVVGVAAVSPKCGIITVTERGFGKSTTEDQFPAKHRGGSGVICHELTEKTGKLAAVLAADKDCDLVLVSSDGQTIRSDATEIRVCGRNSQGVIVFRLPEDASVIAADFAPYAEETKTEEPSPVTDESELEGTMFEELKEEDEDNDSDMLTEDAEAADESENDEI